MRCPRLIAATANVQSREARLRSLHKVCQLGPLRGREVGAGIRMNRELVGVRKHLAQCSVRPEQVKGPSAGEGDLQAAGGHSGAACPAGGGKGMHGAPHAAVPPRPRTGHVEARGQAPRYRGKCRRRQVLERRRQRGHLLSPWLRLFDRAQVSANIRNRPSQCDTCNSTQNTGMAMLRVTSALDCGQRVVEAHPPAVYMHCSWSCVFTKVQPRRRERAAARRGVRRVLQQ